MLAASLGLAPCALEAQNLDPGAPDPPATGFRLEQNYPNPFSRTTTIPFVLEDDLFREGGDVVVTLRVFNLLQQPVGTPVALDHPAGDGVAAIGLSYSAPGRFEARWDAVDQSGNQLASGTYLVQLTVNGASKTRKMLLLR